MARIIRPGKRTEKAKNKPWIDEVARWAKIAGRVANLSVHIRGKPEIRDWIALSVAGLDMAMDIREEQRKRRVVRPWVYFDEDSSWDSLPLSLTSVTFRHIKETEKADIPLEGDSTVYNGKLDGELVAWHSMGGPAECPITLYYKIARRDETLKALSGVIWKDFKTNNLCYTPKGLTEMIQDPWETIDTRFIADLDHRVRSFLDAGKSWGYLLEGPPGSGKSTSIKRIVKSLNLKSLHIELGCLHELAENSLQPSVQTVLKILRPDALVIDDIDRVAKEDQPKLLSLIDVARALCKMVFVTVNNKSKLFEENEDKDSALLRPKRLDDHIQTPYLERKIIADLLGPEDEDLVDQMTHWPIAYVVSYAEKNKVLGREIARAEFNSLNQRVGGQ